MDAPLHPSIFEIEGQYREDRTGPSCRRDPGDLLLGALSYCIFVTSGSYIPLSLVLLFKKGGGVSWRTHPDFG